MRTVVMHPGKQAVSILRQQQSSPDVAAQTMRFRAWTAFHYKVSVGIAEPPPDLKPVSTASTWPAAAS